MKYRAFLLFLATMIWSCEKDTDIVKVEDLIIGNWEHSFSIIGSVRQLSPVGGLKYIFNNDKTFIKSDLASVTWRDEGTWSYHEDSKVLNLTYKTYSITSDTSNTKSLDLTIKKIDEKELVFKADYRKTNSVGEFVEFQFIHYLKKTGSI